MRMRSPSSAPPVRRRVGSTASTAMALSGKLASSRLRISSVTDDLPAPPVPVMPITGACDRMPAHSRRLSFSSAAPNTPASSAVSMPAMALESPGSNCSG